MKKIVIGLVILAMQLLSTLPASADPDSTAPGYISPQLQARAAQKAALERQLLAVRNGTSKNGVSPLVADSGEISMSLWQEPQTSEAANWCGPGSTTAVVGQWRGNSYVDNYYDPRNRLGPDAYQAHLARCTSGDYCEYNTSLQKTTFDDYVRVVNAETQSTFYVASKVNGQDNYNAHLDTDINVNRHPLAPEVNANGLPGWGYNIAHFVTVKQYWVSGNTTTYGDTAGAAQGRTMSANWNVLGLIDFYQNHVAPITNWSYDEIVW